MNRVLLGISFLIVLASAGYYGWTHFFAGKYSDLDYVAATIAVPPFEMAGSAATGQYALQLGNFSDAVASQFGSKLDWTVVEYSREGFLENELERNRLPSVTIPANEGGDSESIDGQALLAVEEVITRYPAADYLLLGKINGLDVTPVRASNTTTLSRRLNRIRSTIDVRIVDVSNRQWLVNRTVVVDEVLEDNSSAETQIEAAIEVAAARVVNAALRAYYREFVIIDEDTSVEERRLGISAGSNQGVEPGLFFKALSENIAASSSVLEIIEVRPDSSVARVVSGSPQIDDRIASLAVDAPESLISATHLSTNKTLDIAFGGIADRTIDSAHSESVVATLEDKAQLYLQQMDGISVSAKRDWRADAVLSEQMLDDLSKGREPALPRGTLTGSDYLIFVSLDYVGYEQQQTHEYEAFGTTISDRKKARGKVDATLYILDVVTGDYVAGSERLSKSWELESDDFTQQLPELVDKLAQTLSAEAMLSIRPLQVSAISGTDIILNHKRSAGLVIGEQFAASRAGADVFDEHTQTTLRNVGGIEFGRLELIGFDNAGWGKARLVSGVMPEPNALLARVDADAPQTATESATESSKRKLNW